ncbi:MAG: hypothetical protein KIT00_03430 [Rhodospirillales bacterium]|nr:hypothetical protein [Xanthobacteraceae bacterium]MCW5698876.1 hypothetical protein [Rhodospirillales bacterium]
MANLTIRNVDDDVVAVLRSRAKNNNRSLEAEIRQMLIEAARGKKKVDLVELADRIAAMTPNVPQTDSVELLREDRDR